MTCWILAQVVTSLVGVATPGQGAEYALTGLTNPPDQNVVKLYMTIGDAEIHKGLPHQWVHLKGVKQNGQAYAMWVLVYLWPGDPESRELVRTARYIFQEGEEPAREYVHALTGEAMLPELRGWDILFPTDLEKGDSRLAKRVHYLGYDFVCTRVWQDKPVPVPNAELISLRPDMLVGTGRTFRDTEGHRLLGNEEYDYVLYSQEDMEELVEAGFNLFWVTEQQYEWARNWPVFCVHPRKGDRYPEMLYRSNMRGGHAYYDEPGHRARRNMKAENTPAEMAQLVVECTQERPSRTEALHRALDSRDDVDLGDLDLRHPLPSWETVVSTVWYQMRAGAIGAIHEGRYILYGQVPAINAHYGCQIPPYPEYLLRYYYAILRGAARHFGCDWGVAVYGRMEQRIAPMALTLAYDMGARYFWFWTSDHGAHVPYPEQVNLARLLKGHAEQHPHRDMEDLLHAAKVAIVLPDGYTFEYSGLMYNQASHHLERVNEHGVTYRRVLHNAAVEMERLLRLGTEFDIVVDSDGFNGEGYEEITFVRADGTISIVSNSGEEHRDTPRTPPRPSLQARPEIEATVAQSSNDPRRVKLHATASAGCPPLGFDIGQDPLTGLQRRVPVIWEHYSPAGGYRLLYGPEHSLDLREPGEHRFRAVATDAYGSIAEKRISIAITE
jgi:hypothetical protein